MIYEISLTGAEQDNGKIELHRLALLANSITEIAKGALQIRIMGISAEKGRTSERITNALKIKLADLKSGSSSLEIVDKEVTSTILELECEPFKETLTGLQGDAFRSEILGELPNQSPMTLVIESFREALNYKEEANHLDKALLKKLKNFEKIFVSQEESLRFTNRGSIPELELQKIDFRKIQTLEESIPEPQEIIINGVVEELKYSKLRVTIATKEGPVNGILSENFDPADISKYWGKDLTIAGTAHYRPSGKMSFVYIEKIFEPTDTDKYFSKPSKKETVEQQIQRQQKQLRHGNRLSEIVGQWPGDENIEEIINALD
ncbi:MAG TPA: hypothetical protein VF939_24510 [Puia sp.]